MSDPAQTQSATQPDAPNVALVRRFVNDVINDGKLALVDDLWTRDLVWEGGSLGKMQGIDAYKKMLGASAGGGWVGLHLTIHEIHAQGDRVFLQFTNSGQRKGRLFWLVPFTSRRASWNGVGVYTVKDGKISHGWFVEDVMAMLRGLGLFGALHLMLTGGGQ